MISGELDQIDLILQQKSFQQIKKGIRFQQLPTQSLVVSLRPNKG